MKLNIIIFYFIAVQTELWKKESFLPNVMLWQNQPVNLVPDQISFCNDMAHLFELIIHFKERFLKMYSITLAGIEGHLREANIILDDYRIYILAIHLTIWWLIFHTLGVHRLISTANSQKEMNI